MKIGLPKKKLVFQPSIFRGYVSFREGIYFLACMNNLKQSDELGFGWSLWKYTSSYLVLVLVLWEWKITSLETSMFVCSKDWDAEMHIIWSNNSDLSRWFRQRIPPKCPKHSGLGIMFCRDIILTYQPYPTLKWFEMMLTFHYVYLFLGESKCASIRFGSHGGALPCDIWPGKSSLVLMEPCSTLFNSDFLMPILAFKTYPPWN